MRHATAEDHAGLSERLPPDRLPTETTTGEEDDETLLVSSSLSPTRSSHRRRGGFWRMDARHLMAMFLGTGQLRRDAPLARGVWFPAAPRAADGPGPVPGPLGAAADLGPAAISATAPPCRRVDPARYPAHGHIDLLAARAGAGLGPPAGDWRPSDDPVASGGGARPVIRGSVPQRESTRILRPLGFRTAVCDQPMRL